MAIASSSILIPNLVDGGLTPEVVETELELGVDVPLLGRLLIPKSSICRLPENAMTVGIKKAEAVLRLGVPDQGGRGEVAERPAVIVALIGLNAFGDSVLC